MLQSSTGNAQLALQHAFSFKKVVVLPEIKKRRTPEINFDFMKYIIPLLSTELN